MKLRSLVALVLSALVLLIPAGLAQAAGFSVGLQAPGHHPQAGKPWKIKVTARRDGGGGPVHGAAVYEFLFGGSVVSTQYPAPGGGKATKPYHFVGSFTDVIRFPQKSVGAPLTFRVVVKAGPLGTRHVDYPVTVRK